MKDFNVYEDGSRVLTESVLNGIDVNNIIGEYTANQYTAIEDCWVSLSVNGSTTSYKDVFIDSIRVSSPVFQNNGLSYILFTLKKGQTISVAQNGKMVVYGIKR